MNNSRLTNESGVGFFKHRWVKEELEKKIDDDSTIKQQPPQYSMFADDPVCDRPKYVQGQQVSEVPSDDFTCDHDYYYYYYDNDATESPSDNDLPLGNELDADESHNEVDEEDDANHGDNDHNSEDTAEDDDIEDAIDEDED